ncbi:hypothetical protein A7975_28695 [Bacillus sp. FJAT-26390]|nr:hypothetical protein A7975_28695 [Bacillus sp. FJAT-26390]
MRKVFIVDDEPFILEGLASIIDWEEYGLTLAGQASNGLEALEALQKSAADILVTDIMMPHMNGLELIKQLKPIHPNMKFIVLSGYHEFDYIREGMRLGIENYLLKPINICELRETIENTVAKIHVAAGSALTSSYQLDILRDNVVNRWVSGKIDQTELKNRLQLLGIPTENCCYAAASIKTVQDLPNYSGGDFWLPGHWDNEVYSISRKQSDCAGNAICFSDRDGDIVIICTGVSSEQVQETALSLLSAIRKELKQRLGIQVLITLGSVECDYSGVSQSYDHSKRLQEYFLTNSEDEIIRYEKLAAANRLSTKSVDVNTLEYERLLLGQNKAALNAFIDEQFTMLQAQESLSPAHIHNCAIELILLTKQTVKENKLNHELATSDYKQLFAALFKAQTISQLTEHVKFIAGSAMDYLSVEVDDFSPVVKQVIHQIQTRYSEELSLKTLSQTLNIHPFYLGQLFQKETGESFSDYVNTYRISRAQKLLKTTAMKTSDISKNIGYLEPGYFYKQFKKYTGVSPKEYRGSQL